MVKKKGYLYTAFLFLILFGIYQYDINQIYGMVEYPDEFGYWATAASMNGWDWSQMASRSSYYSFGYSLILFPILKFCEDSVTAYRLAVTVNFSLIAVSFFLLKGIYKRIFTEQVEEEEILAIGMTLLYPAWIFYAQTTLVDSLLIFMVILICYLFIRFIEVPNISWGIALVAAVMYNYSLHMRSAGVLVAVVITMLFWLWKHPSYWKRISLFLLGIAILFLMIGWVKGLVQGNVYSGAVQETLNINDYGGQWDKIEYLFSLEGLKQMFVIIMGKILYMGVASAGLVFMAILWSIRQMIDCRKQVVSSKEEGRDNLKVWFGIFYLLLVLGQMAICIIYTIRTNNTDWLIYGRYIEAFIPMGIFIGAAYVLQKNPDIKIQVGIGLIYTLAAGSCIYKIWGQTKSYIRGEHSVATTFLIGEGNVNPVHFFALVWLAGMLLMLLMKFGLKLFAQNKFSMAILTAVFFVQAVWGIDAGEIYIYRANDNMAKELIVVNVLEDQLQQGKEIYYLEEGNAEWINYVQMQLREQTLPVITSDELKELDPAKSAVVIDGATKYLDYMEENYNRKIPGFNYYAFYNN